LSIEVQDTQGVATTDDWYKSSPEKPKILD
jgi:hypothetical protein